MWLLLDIILIITSFFFSCRGGESMVITGLVSWSAIAHRWLRGKNAQCLLLLGIKCQCDGQRAEINVGIGILSLHCPDALPCNHKFLQIFHLVTTRYTGNHHVHSFVYGPEMCLMIGSTMRNQINTGSGKMEKSSFFQVEVLCFPMELVYMLT